MTKEVEVGDEYTGKVVKTTTFGAFVELAKGTDGLLHISNIAPGPAPGTVEEVLNKGDEVVRPRGRGRPRARPHRPRLADDPDIAGKTEEELAVGTRRQRRRPAARRTVAAGGDRGPRGGGDGDRAPRGDRGSRGSGRPRHAAARDPERA